MLPPLSALKQPTASPTVGKQYQHPLTPFVKALVYMYTPQNVKTDYDKERPNNGWMLFYSNMGLPEELKNVRTIVFTATIPLAGQDMFIVHLNGMGIYVEARFRHDFQQGTTPFAESDIAILSVH